LSNSEKAVSINVSQSKMRTILVSSIILLLAALILWKQQRFDYNILISCNYFFNHKIYIQIFRFLSHYGMSIISLSYSILIFLSFKKTELEHNKTLFMFVLCSFAIGSIAGDLMKEIVDRARPVVDLSEVLSQTELSNTPSFPSGHTVKSMGLALPFVIMALNKDTITKLFKIIVLLSAILVSFSRIALQKHYLSDVLSGISIALFFMLVAIWAANRFYKMRNIDELKLTYLNKKLGFVFIGLAILLNLI